MNQQLISGVKVERPSEDVAAGTGDVNGAGQDMSNLEGILYVAILGVITSTGVPSLKAQQSDDDGGSDPYADIPGGATATGADTDSQKLLVLDVKRPLKKFVRPVLGRATANVVVDSIIAIPYGPGKLPAALGAAVAAQAETIGA